MIATRLEILVEEPSAEEFLNIIIPKIAPSLEFHIYPSQGKGDLLRNLPSRLRAYRRYLPDDWRILILIDSDGGDCAALKNRLENIASASGLRTKSQSPKKYHVINRIVVQELESWYFGDWNAVSAAYPRVNRDHCRKAAIRIPDAIDKTWETFEAILKKYKCLPNIRLPKIATARKIAGHMKPECNISASFIAFRQALLEVQGTACCKPDTQR